MTGLNLDMLPDLPQRPFLRELTTDLWNDPDVIAVWLGGSLARGAGDAHSDVDLRVALAATVPVADFFPVRLAAQEVYRLTWRIEEDAVLHHLLLRDGQIYDLWVQMGRREPSDEARLVLGCRNEAFAAKLAGGTDPRIQFERADSEAIHQVIGGFWINVRKHQKVLARGANSDRLGREHRLRQELLRLWFVLETGTDCGSIPAMTIHSLTPMVRAVQKADAGNALSRLGRSSETAEEFTVALEQMTAEVAQVGRLLATRLSFEYPAAAEEAARRQSSR